MKANGTTRLAAASLCLAALAGVPQAAAQTGAKTTDPTSFATDADVTAQVKAMSDAMKPGEGFKWQPLVREGANVAAIEIWKKPGRPAVHPAQGEYAIVLDGAGTLVSGGTLIEPETTNPDLVQGSRIEGGTTRKLARGDVILVPAGTPHWFGITGERLVLLGIKLPVAK